MRFLFLLSLLSLSLYTSSAEASSAPRLCLDFGCFYTRHDVNDGSGIISLSGREATYAPDISREEFERKYPIVFWNQNLRFVAMKNHVVNSDYTIKLIEEFFSGIFELGILENKPKLSNFDFSSALKADLELISAGTQGQDYLEVGNSPYDKIAFFIYRNVLTFKLSSDLDKLKLYSSPFTKSPFRPNVFIIFQDKNYAPIYPENILNSYVSHKYVLSSQYSDSGMGDFSCTTTLYVDAVERDLLGAVISIGINPERHAPISKVRDCIPSLFSVRLPYDRAKPIIQKLFRAKKEDHEKPFVRLEDILP